MREVLVMTEDRLKNLGRLIFLRRSDITATQKCYQFRSSRAIRMGARQENGNQPDGGKKTSQNDEVFG
jgi:hypothetical protein